MAPATVRKVKDVFESINGWSKVLTVCFACGLLWGKIDAMDSKLTDIVADHKSFVKEHAQRDLLLAVQEQRIRTLEAEVKPLKEKQ